VDALVIAFWRAIDQALIRFIQVWRFPTWEWRGNQDTE
jgi:hypothetical protein